MDLINPNSIRDMSSSFERRESVMPHLITSAAWANRLLSIVHPQLIHRAASKNRIGADYGIVDGLGRAVFTVSQVRQKIA